MIINVLKSKIHRALVTGADIEYIGSISIDKELMDHAGIIPYEKVLVAGLESGERLETYVIESERGSGEICLNGAAARKIKKGDRVIIMSFALMDEAEAATHKPEIVYVNEKNEITAKKDLIDPDDLC